MCSKVKDFLTDDDFIDYALGVTPEAASQWETYFREHPKQIADVEEARAVLLTPVDVACDFPLVENQDLKDRVVSSTKDFSNISQLDQIEARLVKISEKIDAAFYRCLSDQIL